MGKSLRRTSIVIGLLLMVCLETATGAWPPNYYRHFAIFPHLVGISDIIFTGTPVTTNGAASAEFVVDDVIWGGTSATNITVRDWSPYDNPAYQLGEKYLVCAFTNDWWSGLKHEDRFFGQDGVLLHYVPATNRPPNGKILEAPLLIARYSSAIPFSYFETGGTNYWEGTLSLITNLIDVGRIQCDEGSVREIVESIINDEGNSRRLPTYVIREMIRYKFHRYDWEDNIQSPPHP